jgi:hypothetical protein
VVTNAAVAKIGGINIFMLLFHKIEMHDGHGIPIIDGGIGESQYPKTEETENAANNT